MVENDVSTLERIARLGEALDEPEMRRDIVAEVTAQAPVLMCSVSREPHLTFDWTSDSWHRLLGWKAEELNGREVKAFIHPDDVGLLTRIGTESHGANEVIRLRAVNNTFRRASITWARYNTSIFATILYLGR